MVPFNAVNGQTQTSAEIQLGGFYSDGEELPFWMYNNTRGRITRETAIAGTLSAKLNYELDYDESLEFGGGVNLQDGFYDHIFVDELYAGYQNSWLDVVLGAKHRPELYKGLSLSNESMLWSLNARSRPGIQLRTRRPITLFGDNGIGIEAAWEEYYMGNSPGIADALLHHKMLSLVYKPQSSDDTWQFSLHHYVKWGGESSELGELPSGINDYLRVISGMGANLDGKNVSRNLGSYEVLFKTWINSGLEVSFLYNYIFQSFKGAALSNIPDGRYGVFFDFKQERSLINGLMYELYYTGNQGLQHNTNSRNENYLNNDIYQSGWTYKNRVMASPLFRYNPGSSLIFNNIFTSHHFGLSGTFANYFESYPYKLLLTFARLEGTHKNPFTPKEDLAYLFYEMRILDSFVNIKLQLGAEYSNINKPVYGAGIQLNKRF